MPDNSRFTRAVSRGRGRGEGGEGGGEENGEVPSMIPEAERYASWLVLIVSFENVFNKRKHFNDRRNNFQLSR